ncbi:hypothetical protein Srufu_054240 [Streptomyces libani subsp. rufus]|nr:hypothetical protein Srufu_054240 [Streptomyces libani subsp. rufus]
MQIDGRRQQDVHALAAGFLGEQVTGPAGQLGVPGGGQRRGAGQHHRGVLGAPVLAPHPDRPVRHHQRPESDRGHGRQRPHVLAGQQPGLGVEVERGECPLDGGGVLVRAVPGMMVGGGCGGAMRMVVGHATLRCSLNGRADPLSGFLPAHLSTGRHRYFSVTSVVRDLHGRVTLGR